MEFIDTHTHLFSKEFDDDISDVIENAINSGVSKMLLPNIDSSTTKQMLKLSQQFPKNCFPMIGIHPCSVKKILLKKKFNMLSICLKKIILLQLAK